MLSTLMNFNLYAKDLNKSLAQIASQASIERDVAYYNQNIGKVETLDDLMGDYKLYSYALKAYGLSEHINSPAFVKKILESDLTDPASFANSLTDPRFKAFAAAFDFKSGMVEPGVQSQGQTDLLVEAYSEHLLRGATIAAQKAETFQSAVAKVSSVDALLADPQLFEMVAKIAGLDPAYTSKSFLRAVLMGEPQSGPVSAGLQFLGKNFDFAPNGSAKAGKGAQSASQTAQFITQYFAAVGQTASPQAAAFEARYFETAAMSATKVEDLVNDPTAFRVLRIAAGLPDGAQSQGALVNLLSLPADHEDNPLSKLTGNDPDTLAQREKLLAVKAAFDFENGAGTAPATDAARLAGLLSTFHAGYPKADDNLIALKTNSFKVQLAGMESINDLLGSDPVYGKAAFEYILKAFDLDPALESPSKIRKVLTSDPSDPNSYVGKLGDERYSKLAAAFNFGPDGKVQPERMAQSVSKQQQTATLYAASFGTEQSDALKETIQKETLAYLSAIGAVHSIEGFLEDKTVLDFALKAYGLEDSGFSPADIEKLLTSDLSDPDSFARSFGDPDIVAFAGAFNFDTDGTIEPSGTGVQDAASLLTMENLYLLQMMEEQAGATSEGARLALYFLRKSPDIATPFSILADKALFEVVRTALGLPEQMSQLDIDQQAAILEKRIDFEDFKDPKALDQFIARFAVLYDLNNGTAASDPVLMLFGLGGTSSSGLAGMF